MAVSTTNAFSGPFTPNGVTTVFPFTFKAASADEVGAIFKSASGYVTAVADGAFTVSLTAEGGSVTFDEPPASGSGSLYIVNEPAFTSDANFGNQAPFLPSVITKLFDRSALRDQKLRHDLGRAVSVPFGETPSLLPPAPERALKLQYFDVFGNPTVISREDLGFDINSDFDGGIDGADDGADTFDGGMDG